MAKGLPRSHEGPLGAAISRFFSPQPNNGQTCKAYYSAAARSKLYNLVTL